MSELRYITCAVPPGTETSDFKPFPASKDALAAGCTYPDHDCPVHELERVSS